MTETTKNRWPTLESNAGWKLETSFGHSNPFRIFYYVSPGPDGADEAKYIFMGGGNRIRDALDQAEEKLAQYLEKMA